MDVSCLGLKVQNVGFLITRDPSYILDEKYQTRMPRILGWNMFRLAFNVFPKNMGWQYITLFSASKVWIHSYITDLCLLLHRCVQDLGYKNNEDKSNQDTNQD